MRVRMHHAWCPVHLTLRAASGVPNLRRGGLHEILRDVVRGAQRDDFRIAHYSVQRDHMHMIAEAEHTRALGAGMKWFAMCSARRLNRALGRRGSLWGDRYHRRDITSPNDMRNVLVYVLANHLKHGETDVGLVDPCSSGPWFDGWMHHRDPRPTGPVPTEPPRTWLLDEGWHDNVRFIHLGEVPRALRAGR